MFGWGGGWELAGRGRGCDVIGDIGFLKWKEEKGGQEIRRRHCGAVLGVGEGRRKADRMWESDDMGRECEGNLEGRLCWVW